MAKKRRRRRQEAEPQVENRRETRLRARDRVRNLRLMSVVGGIVGVALLLIIYGAVSELIIKPNSVLAQVEGEAIITRAFWKEARLRKSELENQRARLQLFSQQFGNSSLFASQIASINATLASPLTLGTQVLNEMIEGAVLRIKAPEVGVAVSDEEVAEMLREEVARGQGALTVPQATGTAEAAIDATATAELFTPTPVPTATPTAEDGAESEPTAAAAAEGSETAEEAPTPEPPPVLTDALYEEGLSTLEQNLRDNAGMSVAEYSEVIRARLLRTKMSETISRELVSTTEEQVRVRHILIAVDPEPEPDAETEESSDGADEAPAEATPMPEPESEEESGQAASAPAAETSAEEAAADDGEDAEPASEWWNPDTNEDGRVDDAEALAFAQHLRQRILDGEDFADLALRYSEDPGSGVEGGDLGWAGRGRYVPEFDEVAFSLEIGEISEPVKTTFGYHIIEVLERDDERAKDEAALQQEYAESFQTWLQEQVLSLEIDRPDDFASRLPSGLEPEAPGR
ncbi:MAG: peptidylprolyl isomerase [Caldilineaceae bacterium]|nr:peptidylprolyl isomerase [Caldilineaceae bacterium]